jgi:hypothetical protein
MAFVDHATIYASSGKGGDVALQPGVGTTNGVFVVSVFDWFWLSAI